MLQEYAVWWMFIIMFLQAYISFLLSHRGVILKYSRNQDLNSCLYLLHVYPYGLSRQELSKENDEQVSLNPLLRCTYVCLYGLIHGMSVGTCTLCVRTLSFIIRGEASGVKRWTV